MRRLTKAQSELIDAFLAEHAHRLTGRISEDVDLRVILPDGLSGSAQKRMLSHIKAEVLERLRNQGYEIAGDAVKAGKQNRYISILLSSESLYPRDQAPRNDRWQERGFTP